MMSAPTAKFQTELIDDPIFVVAFVVAFYYIFIFYFLFFFFLMKGSSTPSLYCRLPPEFSVSFSATHHPKAFVALRDRRDVPVCTANFWGGPVIPAYASSQTQAVPCWRPRLDNSQDIHQLVPTAAIHPSPFSNRGLPFSKPLRIYTPLTSSLSWQSMCTAMHSLSSENDLKLQTGLEFCPLSSIHRS